MRKHKKLNSTLCPIEFAVSVIGGKWKMRIIWLLKQKEFARYTELKKEITGITDMMLTQCLKQLVEVEVVERVQYNEIPPRVEYSLTQEGNQLLEAILKVSEWSKKRMSKLGIKWDE